MCVRPCKKIYTSKTFLSIFLAKLKFTAEEDEEEKENRKISLMASWATF